jgi:HPt (histidine-containing phosphotransfer) domain-containing protein
MSNETEHIPDWSAQAVLESLDGSVDDLRQLYEIWQRQCPKLMTEIRDAVQNSNASGLAQAAHTLKGSLQILCADRATGLAADLEMLGRRSQLGTASELFVRLDHEVTAIVTTFSHYMTSV